jgi:hypothetical protein
MASLKLLLGLIPSTAKIELAEKALIAEFDKLNAFTKSDTLKRFNELKDLVTSSSFLQKRKEIVSLSFKGSEEFAKEKEFLSLQKAKDIVLYFRTIAGSGSSMVLKRSQVMNHLKSSCSRWSSGKK